MEFNMSLFTAYLIGVLPGIKWFFIFLCALSFVLALIMSIQIDMEYKQDEIVKKTKYRNGWLFAGIFSAALSAFVPTERDVLTIAGIYVGANAAVAISELDGAKELPQNVIDVANSWLKGISNSEEKK
jgi:hypothetical protein